MSDLRYREAALEDIKATLQLRCAMMRELDAVDLDQDYPYWRERFTEFYSQRMRNGNAQLWLAESDEVIAGMTAAYLIVNQRSEVFRQKSAYLANVYVLPAWRRRGVATRLIALAVDWARAQGCAVVRLRTSAMGRPLYEALGFRSSEEMEYRL